MARPSPASEPPQARTLLLAAVGAVLVALLGWWLVRPAAAPLEATLPVAGSAPTDAGGAAEPVETGPSAGSADPEAGSGLGADEGEVDVGDEPELLVVQAAGAVREPGVVRLPAGSRVDDLVQAAGGFADGADRDRVNLAALVADGERVWIPAVGEEAAPDVVAGGGGGGGGPVASGGSSGSATDPGGGSTPAGPVDLNRATAVELDALPGVGPATAAAILAHRDEVGRFTSVEQLLDVRGIGEAKLEQLRPLVTV